MSKRNSTADGVTMEESLDIMVRKGSAERFHVAYIMHTPVMYDYLSAGFLFSEGIIRSRSDLLGFEGFDSNGVSVKNSLTVLVADDLPLNLKEMQRQFFVNSSCGICGKANINEIFMRTSGLQRSECTIHAETIMTFGLKLNLKDQVEMAKDICVVCIIENFHDESKNFRISI